MPKDYQEIEIRIQNDLDAMKRKKTPKITHFARRFNLPGKELVLVQLNPLQT
jgi:hypothetical protein